MRTFDFKPGFYYDDRFQDHRAYFLTGTKSGNYWIDLTLGEDCEWWKLTWTCIPKNSELKEITYCGDVNPTKLALK